MLTENTKKVWIVVYFTADGKRNGCSKFYSKRGLAVNHADKRVWPNGRNEVLEYNLTAPTTTYVKEDAE